MRRLTGLLVTLFLVGGCTAATSPTSVGPGASASGAIVDPSEAPAGMLAPSPAHEAAPSAAVSDGGRPMVVWQLDNATPADITSSSLGTMDLLASSVEPILTMPETEDGRGLQEMVGTDDGTRTFLFGPSFRGWVDLAAGTLERRPFTVPRFEVAPSHRGDRLAWVDDITGSRVAIVIGGLDGRPITRLELPSKAWAPHLAWSADDRSIVATVYIELPQAAGRIILADTNGPKHGPSATHVLLVPVDGSAISDLADDVDVVTADAAGRTPPPAVLGLPKNASADHFLLLARLSPDGSTLAYAETGYWADRSSGSYRTWKRGTATDLWTVDTRTGEKHRRLADLAALTTMAWSPDGARLAIGAAAFGGQQGLSIVDPRSSAAPRLLVSAAPSDVGDPEWYDVLRWSPDGTWLAYGRRGDAWVVGADGSGNRMIAPHAVAGW